MEQDTDYEVIEIPKSSAHKYGVDVRPDSEFNTDQDESEVNHG